jgi:DNA-binding transcriptional LysR family regulator
MQDLNDLYLYAQVVEHGGFAAASRAIGVPKSKLSRRVGELEARLGVRLIQRSTRQFAVTEIGEAYYRHCVAMLVEAEAAQEVIDPLALRTARHRSCQLPPGARLLPSWRYDRAIHGGQSACHRASGKHKPSCRSHQRWASMSQSACAFRRSKKRIM